MDSKLLSIVATVLLIVGCTPTRPVAPPPQGLDEASAKLAEAAVSISRSMGELASIEKSQVRATPTKPLYEDFGYNMPGNVSLDWSGPVEPLLQKIAGMRNFRFRTLGDKPSIPVIVSITAKDTAFGDILRDIDFQCSHKARVLVYSQSRIVELRYAPH